jgi:hypothetical protein
MDTSLAQNSSLIDIIQKEALGMGILEAFLESAPQFILQCSIILRTGNIGKESLKGFCLKECRRERGQSCQKNYKPGNANMCDITKCFSDV